MPQRVYLHNYPLASPPLFKDSEGEGVQCERSEEYPIGRVECQHSSNCHCEEPLGDEAILSLRRLLRACGAHNDIRVCVIPRSPLALLRTFGFATRNPYDDTIDFDTS